MSWERSIALLLGGAAAGVAAYDFIRGRLYPTLSSADIKGEGPKQVGGAAWASKVLSMKPLKRPPIIITSIDQIDPMIKELDLSRYRPEIVNIVRQVTEKAENALAVQGDKHDYLILPAKVNRVVVEHEIGHLRAKEEGKEHPPGFIDRLASVFWKPSYRKTTIDPEETAWGYVKGESGEKRRALGTYESGFHKRRSDILGRLGAALLLGGVLTPP